MITKVSYTHPFVLLPTFLPPSRLVVKVGLVALFVLAGYVIWQHAKTEDAKNKNSILELQQFVFNKRQQAEREIVFYNNLLQRLKGVLSRHSDLQRVFSECAQKDHENIVRIVPIDHVFDPNDAIHQMTYAKLRALDFEHLTEEIWLFIRRNVEVQQALLTAFNIKASSSVYFNIFSLNFKDSIQYVHDYSGSSEG